MQVLKPGPLELINLLQHAHHVAAISSPCPSRPESEPHSPKPDASAARAPPYCTNVLSPLASRTPKPILQRHASPGRTQLRGPGQSAGRASCSTDGHLRVGNRPPGVAAAKYHMCRRVPGTAGPKMSSPARLPSPELPTDPCSAAASHAAAQCLVDARGPPRLAADTPTCRCRVHISRPRPPCRRRHARLPVATPHNEGIPQLTAGCILHGRMPAHAEPVSNPEPPRRAHPNLQTARRAAAQGR